MLRAEGLARLMDPTTSKKIHAVEPASFHPRGDEYVDLGLYVRLVRARWRAIAFLAIASMLLTGIVTEFVMTRWYRAEAVIRPVASPAVESRIAGLSGGLGGAAGGIAALAGIGGGPGSDAEEYIAILDGFKFNVTLADQHRLRQLLSR